MKKKILIAAGILCFAGSSVRSQDVANGLAIANVLATLTVTATQPLDFGNVFQGVAKTQDETSDALSGIFTIAGEPNAALAILFTLPDYIALASGADRMTISFSGSDCTFSVLAAAAPSTPSAPGAGALLDQNPRNLLGTTVGAGGVSQLFLGGRVTPSVNQSAGAYTGDVLCTVAYTGS